LTNESGGLSHLLPWLDVNGLKQISRKASTSASSVPKYRPDQVTKSPRGAYEKDLQGLLRNSRDLAGGERSGYQKSLPEARAETSPGCRAKPARCRRDVQRNQ